MNHIVITGEGVVCAIGNNKTEVLNSLLDNKSGIGEMHFLQSSHHELPVGEVKLSNDEMKTLLGINTSEQISRTTLMGMLAVRQALEEANIIYPQKVENKRIVLISGTTVGGMDISEQLFDEMILTGKPHISLLKHDCGSSTEDISHYFGVFKEETTISTACSSAANALILGAELLKAGEADMVVVGGTEALTRFHLNGFNSLMILDNKPCRPFDEQRAGLNLGEGAAFVVLETEASAIERQVPIHAYLSGYGNACDAFHQTASSDNGEGAYLAMKEALEMAHLKPTDIDYINAHGTGTPNNDLSESMALKRIFTEAMPPVSSTKPFTGHTTSASGSIETVICLLAMQYRFIPANLNWEHQIPNGITPTIGEKQCDLHHVICNAFGFGGNDTSLILSAVAPSDSGVNVSTLSQDYKPHILAQYEITDEAELVDIRHFVNPLEARRMGKLMKSSLLASMKVLGQAGIEKPDAIITATSLGCLENSELLLKQLQDEGEVMLKPTFFMQSTHNTIGSAIAIHLKCHGYNTTYTHGTHSLEWALRDAKLLLMTGKAKNVLVGLHEETTTLYRSLMEQLGENNLPSIHSLAMVLTCGK